MALIGEERLGRTARTPAHVVNVPPVDHATVVAWVRATCAAQGLPEKVSDPTILRKVAVLLRPGLAGLPVPNRRYSRRVKPIAATDGRSDQSVIEKGGDDVALAGEGQFTPLSAQGGGVGEVAAKGSGSAVDGEGSPG